MQLLDVYCNELCCGSKEKEMAGHGILTSKNMKKRLGVNMSGSISVTLSRIGCQMFVIHQQNQRSRFVRAMYFSSADYTDNS